MTDHTAFFALIALLVMLFGGLGMAAIVKIIQAIAARRRKANPFLENEQDWGRQ